MSSRVEIASIEEWRGVAEELLTPTDHKFIESLRSERRRGEVRAWRGLLRQTLRDMELKKEASADIAYSPIGAPYIVDSDLFISVSHSAKCVAIIVDNRPCAIDIEESTRDFERASARYATAAEQALATPPPLGLIWSAKEVLYKISGLTELNLLSDISITEISKRSVVGRVGDITYNLHIKNIEGHILVHS